MRLPQISVKFDPVIYEEIYRLARENRQTASEVVRQLVRAGIITQAEKKTDSQFEIVEKHLCRLEDIWSKQCVQLSKATAKNLFFVEWLALFGADEEEQTALKENAEKQARYFLQSRLPKPGEYEEQEE